MLEAMWLLWRKNTPEQANEWAKVSFPDGPFLSFDYISLGLRRRKLSSKLTNLFPDPSQACVGSSAYPTQSYYQVSQDGLHLFMSLFWCHLHMPQSFASSPGFYRTCTQQRNVHFIVYSSPL